ncbi:dolichol-phosphate mannosyltransferase [Bifidobacterium vansinderenii]|uniref:Dolichol-phosphate mannosyltransferase n=2 Tax=Bifidobacterium vansinderenii TaxID=1984871 RepID=A0A229VX70_9BIFI|nr:dolichol-phosphate mannosyltransferase [Bifidobacterium vansinderenii]
MAVLTDGEAGTRRSGVCSGNRVSVSHRGSETIDEWDGDSPRARDSSTRDSSVHGPSVCDSSVVVVMPTYNEKNNLPVTIPAILRYCPDVHILIVDDNSPDGTGDLADAMAGHDPRIHVLHRAGKGGLGPAYLAGFRWALDRGYDVICEMDMDGSHRPQDLPRLLAPLTGESAAGAGSAGAAPASETSSRVPGAGAAGGRRGERVDLVIGSRRVRGGRSEGWPWYRNLISSCGSWYARVMLGSHVHDMTAGFRAYRASMLRSVRLDSVEAGGYVFQIDMTRRVLAAGGVIREVPIVFPQRALGVSKMSSAIVIEAMWRVTVWGLQRLLRGRRRS